MRVKHHLDLNCPHCGESVHLQAFTEKDKMVTAILSTQEGELTPTITAKQRRKNLINQHYCPDCGLPMNHARSTIGKKVVTNGYYCELCGFSPDGIKTITAKEVGVGSS